MLEYFISGIIGAVAGWLAATQHYRMDIYQKKYEACRLIHDTAGQVFVYGLLCIKNEEAYGKDFNFTQRMLFDNLLQNELIISGDVIRKTVRLVSYDISQIREDEKAFSDAMSDITNAARKELKIKEIHTVTSILLSLPVRAPDALINKIAMLRKGRSAVDKN